MALRWFDSIGGNTNHNLSIFVYGCWQSARIASSTTPTTARRGTRSELLNGRREENENENDNDNGNGNGNDNDNEKSVKSVVSDVEKKQQKTQKAQKER